jgi:hypothetical protein
LDVLNDEERSTVLLTIVPIPNVDDNLAPSLVDILATEWSDILDILVDNVVLPSSKYLLTANRFKYNIRVQFLLSNKNNEQ